MAYTIPYTDEANKGVITIEDNTINQETSLKLPGRNTTAYGSAISENFLHLLENFASSTQPAVPLEGQLWYDSTPGVEQLKVYDGTNWVASGGLKREISEPDANQSLIGDLWVDTKNQQLYLYSGSGWVLVGPEFSEGLITGISPQSITGTDDLEYNILKIEVSSQPVAILSTYNFTPKVKIAGFTVLYPGINLSSNNITGAGVSKYYGISEKAENLLIAGKTVPAANFLRADTVSTTGYQLAVRNNNGISFGINAELDIGVDGNAGVIQHNIAGSSIDFKVKNDGTYKNIVRLDSNLNVGINNTAPEEALDITGNLKLSGKILTTNTDETISLATGSIVSYGGAAIAKSLQVGNALKVVGTTTTSSIVPAINNNSNIGSSDLKYANIYATTFIGSLQGTVNGTVTGRAGSADKLTSPTTFRFEGDVSANDVVFDGQAGSSVKIFATEISNNLITSKEEVTFSQTDDEFLFNRSTTGSAGGATTGLKKITRKNLLAAVPVTPIGVIVPYAGVTAPFGWLLCDGSEVSVVVYSMLYEVIGENYKPNPADGYFGLPDLRGRFTLGADNMGGNFASVVDDLAASIVGAKGGSDTTIIQTNNLPEHKHDLRGDSGDQFYVLRDVSGTPNDDNAIIYDAPTGTGVGQALSDSGGVVSDTAINQPLNTMNPFMTVNYIIYAGEG